MRSRSFGFAVVRMAKSESPEREVHKVTGHVAERALTEIPPATPVSRMEAALVERELSGRSEPGGALAALKPLTNLEELYLRGTLVDNESCTLIASFPKLRKLRLARTQVSDVGLESLSVIKTLEDLDLSEISVITNAGMDHLAKLTSLKKLNLWRVQVSDEGILKLATLTRLESLNLDNSPMSNGGLPVLKNMNSLVFLHLGSTQLTDAAAPSLFHLKNLKELNITRTTLASSPSAVAELTKQLPNTKIRTEYVEQP